MTVDLKLGVASLQESLTVVDLRLTKVLSLGGARHLEIFLEPFNATNAVILNNGSGTITNRTAFTPTTARDARQMQLGARFAF